jgi:hypothetical protein
MIKWLFLLEINNHALIFSEIADFVEFNTCENLLSVAGLEILHYSVAAYLKLSASKRSKNRLVVELTIVLKPHAQMRKPDQTLSSLMALVQQGEKLLMKPVDRNP